jgi:hypothetical protein
MPLTIETYNREESNAIAGAGYAQIAAFQTSTFNAFGFPTNASLATELLRYVDYFAGMDALERLEPGRYFPAAGLRSDFTFDEVAMLTKISKGVGDLTERNMGRRLTPHFSHMGGMGHARMVHAIATAYNKDSASVFEVGPGAGYAGVILGLLGHKYSSYDITQGYYLWQSRLLSHFFAEEFLECCGEDNLELSSLPRIAHMPWWVYMNLFKNCPLRADIILSNANLGEMNYWCLRYVLRICRIMFQDSPIGMIVYGNPGDSHHNSEDIIENELEIAGFVRVVGKSMNAFALADHLPARDLIERLEMEVPKIGDDGSGKTYGPLDFLSFDGDDMHDEFDFFSFLADWPELGAR